jgi:hypothetical protein
MKTQVIQLTPHDDVTSVRDKMSWAKTPRLLLVFPRRSRLSFRTLDLHLLQRHAATLGAQLAIVTRSGDLRRAARAMAIPVFDTASLAQQTNWRTRSPTEAPRRRAPRPDLRQMRRAAFPAGTRWSNPIAVRLVLFSLAVLAVLAILLLFLPSASIELTPATRSQSLTIAVSASPEVTTVNLAGSIPAHSTSLSLERSKTTAASGSLNVPDAAASGIVRFRNLTTGTVNLPAGTVVRTTGDPGIRFATRADAVMPAGAGKTLDVPVQAVEGGASGNLPADSLVAIEDNLIGTSLAVTNPDPTSGGTERAASAPTADDRSQLHEALSSEILAECQAALPKTLASGDVYFPATLVVAQVLSETYFPAEGQPGATLSLTMKLQCQAQYAAAADVSTLAKTALEANLPVGYAPLPAEVATTVVGVPQTDTDGITRWGIQTERLVRAHPDPLAVLQLVLGRRPADAVIRLSASLPLAAAPIIRITPSWWPWLPLLPFRITISTGD